MAAGNANSAFFFLTIQPPTGVGVAGEDSTGSFAPSRDPFFSRRGARLAKERWGNYPTPRGSCDLFEQSTTIIRIFRIIREASAALACVSRVSAPLRFVRAASADQNLQYQELLSERENSITVDDKGKGVGCDSFFPGFLVSSEIFSSCSQKIQNTRARRKLMACIVSERIHRSIFSKESSKRSV